MKIDRIRCRIISHPLRPSWAPGRTFEQIACTLVEISTDQGLTGAGALPHADAIGLRTMADLVVSYILGVDPLAAERISPILRHASPDGAQGCWCWERDQAERAEVEEAPRVYETLWGLNTRESRMPATTEPAPSIFSLGVRCFDATTANRHLGWSHTAS
jgi:hypothetical protein